MINKDKAYPIGNYLCMGDESAKKIMFVPNRKEVKEATRNLENWTESLVAMKPSSRLPRDVLAAICSAAAAQLTLCLPQLLSTAQIFNECN